MGRTTPSHGLPPASQRKEARAKDARTLVNKTIPALLAPNARARKGVDAAELITDPPPLHSRENASTPSDVRSTTPPLTVRVVVADTLTAASQLLVSPPAAKARPGSNTTKLRKNVAVLNMASPLRPGGGLLNGATSQEETLCLRTTLYPSLREEFYRLPEVGVVFTPDVMVFRDEEGRELGKRERWWVDVVSGGILRFPDVDGEGDGGGEEGEGGRYANDGDRTLVEAKMRAVLRVLRMKQNERAVLGAWGCGAYGNPVGEVARAWERVLLGEQQQQRGKKKKKKKKKNSGNDAGVVESWEGLKEVVFAIKDRKMAVAFARCFGGGLQIEEIMHGSKKGVDDEGKSDEDVRLAETEAKVQELETQISQVRNPDLKARLEDVLVGLGRQLVELSGGDDEESDGVVDREIRQGVGVVEEDPMEEEGGEDEDSEEDQDEEAESNVEDENEEEDEEHNMEEQEHHDDRAGNEDNENNEDEETTKDNAHSLLNPPTLQPHKTNPHPNDTTQHRTTAGETNKLFEGDKFFDDVFFREDFLKKRRENGEWRLEVRGKR